VLPYFSKMEPVLIHVMILKLTSGNILNQFILTDM
jgi:hypothetical protein